MDGAAVVQPSPALVRIALAGSDVAELGPLTLRVGQRLLAEVLAVQAETGRTILSLAGRRVEAQVPVGLRQGEVVRLLVAEALPDRLVFRVEPPEAGAAESAQPLPHPPAQASAPAPALVAVDAGRVLAELDLPDTPAFRAAVEALIEQQEPLARETLVGIRSAIAAAPGDEAPNARAAVRLIQDGVPLTARSLQLAQTALAGPTAAPLGILLGELVRALADSAPEGQATPGPNAPPVPPDAGPSVRIPSPEGHPATVGQLRDLVLQLAVGSPRSEEVARAVRLLSTPPEAVAVALAASAEIDVARGQGPPHWEQVPRSIVVPTTSPRAALQPAAAGALLAERLAEAAPALAPLQTPPVSPSLAGSRAEAPGVPPEASARTLLVSLAALVSEAAVGAAEPRSREPLSPRPTSSPAQASDADAAPTATSDRPRTGPFELRQLISVLHDRIELQQLRTAARAATSQPRRLGSPGALAVASQEPTPEAEPGQATAGRELAALAPRPAATPATAPGPTLSPLFVSVPLALGGQFGTLELVVQREPDGRHGVAGESSPVINASLLLELRYLGQVGAEIRLQGAQLRCRLRASRPDTAERVSHAADRLRERLEGAGLDVRALECTLAAPPPGQTERTVLRHVAVEA